jgi:D-alanyl-D-alanine carboxypeptidase
MNPIVRLSLLLLCTGGFANAQSFDPTLSIQLQNTIDSIRTANNVKGISACAFYPGMGTWKGVSGISHAGSPITVDMEFGIASNTKLFTAVLMLKLAENNLIGLDDSLYHYLPPFTNIDSTITIRQLLNHTTGLDDVTSVPGYPDSMLNDPNRVFTASELMTWAGTPSFAPGGGWEYCNTNYLLAALIAESATGITYGQLLRDSILTPLQLDSTFLDVYDSVLYTIAHPWQAGFDNSVIPRTSVNSAAWSAGAMYSTASEMVQWYHALHNGQVLNPNSYQEMTTFVGSGSYGMGISEATILGRTVWLHGGQIWGGYNSSMMYDTATGIVVCVLINQIPASAFQVAIQLLSALVSTTVGIDESNSDQLRLQVYPNPASDRVHITLPEPAIRPIQFFDSKGHEFAETTDTDCVVSDFPAGLYLIRAQTEQGTYWGKFLRQ